MVCSPGANAETATGAGGTGGARIRARTQREASSMDKLTQITTFVRVVEHGGFSAAARDLQVAPSVVTTQIQALEQQLGVRLLNRNTRSVKPTEVGDAYFERC